MNRFENPLTTLLRDHGSAPPLPNPEFFSHQIMERIRAEDPQTAPAPAPARWFPFTLPRLAWAGALCLLLSYSSFRWLSSDGHWRIPTESEYLAQIMDPEPGRPDISATEYRSTEENVTVLWLEGLDYIADQQPDTAQ